MKLIVSILILLLVTCTPGQGRFKTSYGEGVKSEQFEIFFGETKLEDQPDLGDYLSDLKLDNWFTETTFGSGDFPSLEKIEQTVLSNDTNEDEMQNIMKMLFGDDAISTEPILEVNSNPKDTSDKTKNPKLPELLTNKSTEDNDTDFAENKQRREKNNMPEDHTNLPLNAILNRLNILEKVNEMLNEKKNVSFEIVNGDSVVIHTIDKLSSTRKPDEYDDISHMATTTERIITSTTILSQIYVEKLEKLIADGFLKEDIISQIENGEITIAEIQAQLMKNRTFIISRFPPRFSTILEGDQFPEEIENKIFSGNMTLPQVKYEVYQNDELAKAMLPEQLREILEDRDPPQEIKDMLYEGWNDSYINNTVRKNDTLMELIMSDSMFYFYNLFKDPKNVALNMAMSGTSVLALICVMTSLGKKILHFHLA